ncbi:hypothetical protein [Hymenobacter sp. CRA2]|uniref:hypothetical protein n=1 Tax=Hymenobacter sp. CRA2 TaxID=1955620 RepID=UPI001116CE32|nr:hypothetical protein [Hymenobacter sp. CRA2]
MPEPTPAFPSDPLCLRVLVDDADLDAAYPVLTAEIYQALHQDGHTRLELAVTLDAAEPAAVPLPGTALRICAGYGAADAVLFDGTVATYGLQSGPDQDLRLVLTATQPAAPAPDDAEPVLSLSYGDALLDFAVELDARAGLRGAVRFPGSALARPGVWLALSGLPRHFNGPAYVTAATHTLAEGGWQTSAQLAPLPEPAPPTAPVRQAGLTTAGRFALALDDQRCLTVSTPGGQQLVLDDDARTITLVDSNANRVLLSPDGIRLDSSADLQLHARGHLELRAASCTLAADSGDLQLQGLNVAAAAQMQLSLSGAIAASLSATGQTTVKGALVTIN